MRIPLVHALTHFIRCMTPSHMQLWRKIDAGVPQRRDECYFAESRRVLEHIVSGADLHVVLLRIVELAEQFVPGSLCSILLVDHEAHCLRLGAAPRLPDAYNATIDGIPYGLGIGSCGTAAASGHVAIAADIATHPHWHAFREAAAAAGLRACWSLPAKNDEGTVLATVAMYFLTPRQPTERDLHRLGIAAHLVAIALIHQQHEEELHTARLAAEAANRAKGAFLANMSHEIRTPMNAIIGLTRLCQQTELNHQQRDYLDKVLVSAHILLDIINDILDFSKIDAGKIELDHVPFELESVLGKLATLTALKAEEKGLELIMETDLSVPPHLQGDPLRLEQVLLNLVGNALKFTERGEVHVYTALEHETEQEAWLRFTVRDTGIGMTAEERARLFRPFTQADGSIARRFGGTGLGLSISQHLVNLMDGTITVDSQPGRGSCFSFTARFGKSPREQRCRALPPDLRQLRVLAVDDHATSLHILTRYLESFGFDVVAASDGTAALRQLDQATAEPFDLVILAWKMRGIDGIKLAELIRARQQGSRPPKILLISSFGTAEMRRHLHGVLVDGLLAKPFLPSGLFDAIVELFAAGRKIRSVSPAVAAQSAVAGLRGMRILLVEDHPINRELAVALLEQVGIVVTTANDGQECLARLAGQTFDAVLMDMQMPVMDGLTATRAIRQQAHWRDLPIIAMTANALVGDREQCLAAGMNDYVAKPIEPEQLYAVLARHLAPTAVITPSSPPTAPAHASADLPPLPGIDTKTGLYRLNGDRTLYLNLLFKCQRQFDDTVRQLRQVLPDPAARDEARRLVHTLKGLAGTIGANTVAEAACTLEQAIVEQADSVRCLAALDQLAAALTPVQAAIASIAHLRPAPAAAALAPTTHTAELHTLFSECNRLLRACDAAVETPVARLCSALTDTPWASQAALIQERVADYDYEQALVLLAPLAKVLNLELEGAT